MTHLYPALNFYVAFAVRGWVARFNIAKVGNAGWGEIALDIDVDVVIVVFVGATREVFGDAHCAIDEHINGCMHGAKRARTCAKNVSNSVFASHSKGRFYQGMLLCFHSVEGVIAAQDERDQRRFLTLDDERFDRLLDGQTQKFNNIVDGSLVRCLDLAECCMIGRTGWRRYCLSQLNIGSVVTLIAEGDEIFTGIG